ncbi:MAG: alpha/beta hydrolase [Steroidobacteraceae bacterium]
MVLKPPRAERIAIAGPAGDLQTLVETPATEQGERRTAPAFAVVCHPHPLHAGTMDNKVVYTVARVFEQLGAAAIRFNFRGVGASAGSYDEGRGEAADALAVIAWGRRRWPEAVLWLAGFSFGGAVAVRIAGEAHPARLVLVAPGITRFERTEIDVGRAAPACPWLIVQGDADEVVPPQAVRDWAGALSPLPGVSPPRLRVLAGAGHFFHGRINDLRDTVLAFMRP